MYILILASFLKENSKQIRDHSSLCYVSGVCSREYIMYALIAFLYSTLNIMIVM